MTYYTSMAYICCCDDVKVPMLAIIFNAINSTFLTCIIFNSSFILDFVLFYFIIFMSHLFGEDVVCYIK